MALSKTKEKSKVQNSKDYVRTQTTTAESAKH